MADEDYSMWSTKNLVEAIKEIREDMDAIEVTGPDSQGDFMELSREHDDLVAELWERGEAE